VSSPMEIFRGTITGLEAEFREEGPPELLILAEDAAQQARMARRTKTYEDMSLADLAQAVADRLGLQPVVNGLSERLGTWVQLNESDLALAGTRVPVAVIQGDEARFVAQRGDVHRALSLGSFNNRKLAALSVQYQFGSFVHKQLSLKVQSGENNVIPNVEATLNRTFLPLSPRPFPRRDGKTLASMR